ncbi:holin [Acinetobacter haemolyticus]|uniref:holin n=1 Tax=Acinetobacter haemolyticus TaxID=29430 RepID=UPI001373139F|nr:hypothetical protein [Acinetobacter haemolyticus]NAR92828.1 hypothetical protein [Acinetobacter haemolyticus]
MSEHKTQAVAEVAAAVSSVASKTTYVGAGTGFFAWLLSIDVLPLLGFLLALVRLMHLIASTLAIHQK